MANHRDELVYARTIRALEVAARAIGIEVDVARHAPTASAPIDGDFIPLSEQFAFVRAIFEAGDDATGLALGRHLPVDPTGLWGFLLRSAPTYGDMLRRAERFIRIVNKFPEFDLIERGPNVALVSPAPDETPFGHRHQVVVVTLTHWIQWGRELTGEHFPVAHARFRGGPTALVADYRRYFGGVVDMDAGEDSLELDAALLALPLKEATPELRTHFEGLAETMIEQLEPAHGFVGRVEGALHHDEPAHGFVGRVEGALHHELLAGAAQGEHVARRLAVSPRTLHRRLAEQGTSFRKVKDELLKRRAEGLMRAQHVSLSEISYLLGYAEPASFNRAVRRWTGLAPGAWRARMAASRPEPP